MKVLCYGAGAVGSLLGGRLAANGHDVTLLVRPNVAPALRQHGLSLRSPDGGTVYARPRVITDTTQIRPVERPPQLIILSAKAYDTAAAAPEIARICDSSTTVLTVQNGLGNEEVLAEAVGPERVLSGAFTLSVSIPEAGTVVQHTSSGGLALAGFHRPSKMAVSLAQEFAYAGVRARVYPDWRAMKWSKLLLNILGNASCAVLEMSPGEVFTNGQLFRLEQRCFREARRVMRRLHLRPVNLPGYPVRLACAAMSLPPALAQPLMARRVAGGRGDKMPSLAIDRARGKDVSEVAWLNGAVAAAAAECRVGAVANALLADTLQALMEGRIAPEQYRHNPQALLSGLRRR